MLQKKERILAVPVNVITGFLGVGKTSAILNLLRRKPEGERWAVLVNEFGEIGIDGSLLEGLHSKEKGIYIRDVPGGCMCCTAGLPMQVALNQLLAQARPDRLLVEPTGLGHPKEVLQALSSEQYRDVLSLQKTITLVDARKLSDVRYTHHETFNQQIAIADTIVGNKMDLYQNADKSRLVEYVKMRGKQDARVLFTQHGEIALSELNGSVVHHASGIHEHDHDHDHHHAHQTKPLAMDLPMPACGFIRAVNQGEGFQSAGWRFSAEKVFSRQRLLDLLKGFKFERLKGVFITDEGYFGYNLTADGLTETPLLHGIESRIELISENLENNVQSRLLSCIADQPDE